MCQTRFRVGRGLTLALPAALAACGSSNPVATNPDTVTIMPPPAEAAPALMTCRMPDAAPLPAQRGLPVVARGPRPGPDLLYADAPAAPQLENRHPRFRAAPLLVQGHEAYIDGEYLYQDYLYDDYGSDTDNDDLNEVPVTVGNSDLNGLEPRVGDVTYPTNFDRYGNNAADIVEVRIAPGDDDVAYRITLNTLLEQDSTVIVLAFDMDGDAATGSATLPRDPGAPFPGTDEAIFLWGSGAEHVDLSGDTTALTNFTTDLEANQLTVFVPRSLHNPAGDVGLTVAAGLYDTATGGWLMPGMTATAEQPGGAGLFDAAPAGIFNLAFRFDEAVTGQNTPPDTFQSDFIRRKLPTQYQHTIRFDDLGNGINSTTVPATGTQVRIFASHFTLGPNGEGRDLAVEPSYFGQLQPYSVYIPSGHDPDGTPSPLHWAFHSNAQEHWQYNGSNYVQQIGEQLGAVVPTNLGRGPRNWYEQVAEADVFEVWADVARHFNIDANRVATTGYSMGGYATYRLGVFYPDLFGKALTEVGPPGDGIWVPPGEPTDGFETLTNLLLENTRNLPYMNLAAVQDELVPYSGPQAQNLGNPGLGLLGFEDLGYRYRFLSFPTAEHYTLFLLDDFPMVVPFLADTQVDRNPFHVTFSYSPETDSAPEFGMVHDHAYWVSELRLADEARVGDFPAKGTVDAMSLACGLADPESSIGADAGAQPLEYTENNRTWAAPAAVPAANVLELTLSNLQSLRIDAVRAGLDPTAPILLRINSDTSGSLTLDLASESRQVVYGAGSSEAAVLP